MNRTRIVMSRQLRITLIGTALLVAAPTVLTSPSYAALPASHVKRVLEPESVNLTPVDVPYGYPVVRARSHIPAHIGGPPTPLGHVSPNSLVLAPDDVPSGYLRVSAVHFTLAELAQQGTWSVGQLIAWGYLEGFESQFSRSPDTAGQAQLSSNAGVYKTARGAALSLAANAENCTRLEGWRELTPPPTIGDEAHLCKVSTVVRDATATTYFVVWRIGRYKGSVSLTGLEGTFVPADALAFARAQARKMRRVIHRLT